MATKNKEGNAVVVDIGKLNAGLAAVFHDIGTVFEAIGVEEPAMAAVMNKVPGADVQDPAEDQNVESDAAGQTDNGNTKTGGSREPVSDEKEAEAPAEAPQGQADSAGAGDEAEPSITYEELTEIIVKKIEKDRSVSDKVRDLLTGKYGVEKAKFLPKAKYEEFLTDISAL